MKLIDTIPIYRTSMIAVYICLGLGVVVVAAALFLKSHYEVVAGVGMIILSLHLLLTMFGVYDVHCGDRYVMAVNDTIPANFFDNYIFIKSYEYSNAILVEKKGK